MDGGATFYPHDGLDAEAVRLGEVDKSDMTTIVHELTHCFQWLVLGFIRSVFYYLFAPLPTYWTGRSTLEFESEANRILWLKKNYGEGDWLDDVCRKSAEKFTGGTYVWASTDTEGWYWALKRVLAISNFDDKVDGRSVTDSHNLNWKFNGYNPR